MKKYKFIKPIIMPRGSHYGSNYWECFSKKLGRVVRCFSNLEYENIISLEMNPDVEYFCEQPLEIKIKIEDELKKSTFDFWVKYKNNNEEFQEVKYSSELEGYDDASLRTQEQIRRQKKWCEINNYNHVIRTEKEIHKGHFYIRNLNFMFAKVKRYEFTDENYYKTQLTGALKALECISIDRLIHMEVLPIRHELDLISLMYYEGIIKMDVNTRPIDIKTEVSLWQ